MEAAGGQAQAPSGPVPALSQHERLRLVAPLDPSPVRFLHYFMYVRLCQNAPFALSFILQATSFAIIDLTMAVTAGVGEDRLSLMTLGFQIVGPCIAAPLAGAYPLRAPVASR